MELNRNPIRRIDVGESLTRPAFARPQRPAVVEDDRRWIHGRLDTLFNPLAPGLAGRGCRPGDAVALASGSSAEVERAVYDAEPEVAEVVVVGLPHERWSEAITAVVVPGPGERIDPGAPTVGCEERLGGHEVPKAVIVVDELPRTSTGKVRKNVGRDIHAGRFGGR